MIAKYLVHDKNMSANINMIINGMVLALLILFGTYNPIFALLALIYIGYLLLSSDFEYGLIILIYIMPTAGIFKWTSSATSFFTFIELFYLLLFFMRFKSSINRGIILLVIFGAYILISQIIICSSIDYTTTIKMLSHFILIFCAAEQYNRENNKIIILSYIYGLIASTLISFCDSDVFRISSFISVKSSQIDDMVVNRFAGLYTDPNYYSVNLIIALCALVILYYGREISLLHFSILSTALVVFDGLTASKSAIIMLIIPLILLLLTIIQYRDSGVTLFFLVVAFLLVMLFGFIKIPLFSNVIIRFHHDSNDIDSLFSMRVSIWKDYIDYYINNPLSLFFGHSIQNIVLNKRAPHNTYLDMIYQLGLIGSIYLVGVVSNVFSKAKGYMSRNIYNYSILVVIAIMYFFLSELQYFDLAYHFIMAFYVYNYSTIQRTSQNNSSLSKYIKQ